MGQYVLINGRIYDRNELAHHGIKGMKWGRRRWQNNDGSLTPAGRQRYSDDVYEKKAAYKQAKKDYKQTRKTADSYEDVGKGKDARAKAKFEYEKAKKDYDNSAEGKEAAAARRKKAIKVGVAVAGTALAAYGAYKLNDYVKTKNCQIAAERGHEFARKQYHQAVTDALARDLMPGATSERIYISSGANNAAKGAASRASKDSFAKAAKNVVDFKKSGRSLDSLHTLNWYNDRDEFIEFTKKRKN